MNYIKVTYGVGNSFIKSTFEDNSTYVKTSVNSTFIKVAYDGGEAGLDAERLRTKVYNVTGGTLVKGTVVYINGSHGNLPSVAKAIATSDATSAQTMGLVLADITDNKSGYIILAGKLSDLDTQAIPNGSQLYLSSTIAGTYTTTKQYAPAHLVYIGVVNRSHPTQGEIEVRIANGYEADEIHDFAVRNPSNNDGIFFNSTTSLWEKKQVSAALGYTPVPTSRTITINGVSYDLSADRAYTIAAGISGSGTSGQVAFWNGASSLSGVNGLFWDNANTFLGVGTNSYTDTIARMLVVSEGLRNPIEQRSYSNVVGGGTLYKRARSTFASPSIVASGDYIGAFEFSGYNGSSFQAAGLFALQVDGTPSLTSMPGRFTWHTTPTGSNTYVERMRLVNQGNLLIGLTSDDGINRLQVSGSAKFTSDILVNGINIGLGAGNVASNLRFGGNALISNTSGAGNVALGYAAMYFNTGGSNNMAIGVQALVGNSTGDNNVAVGTAALFQNSNGYNNVAIGHWAGYDSVGSLGNSVGANNIFIGYGCLGESGTDSNRTWIGNASTTSTWVGGNLLVGTRTNGSERLQVVGDVKIVGSGTSSATNALRVLNSSSSVLLNVRNDGEIAIGAGGWLTIGNSQRYIYKGINQTTILSICADSNVGSVIDFYGSSHATKPRTISLVSSFTPTSGSIAFAGFEILNTINQTGTANGITRGLYVAPTLTNAFDWRSIETTNNSGYAIYAGGTANSYFGGNVGIGGLPVGGYRLRLYGTLWADGIGQLSSLQGNAGVGSITFYEQGTLSMNVYGPHAAESVKGFFTIKSQDLGYTSPVSVILHADADFLDHPTMIIRSRNLSANSIYFQNYHYSLGALFTTLQPSGGNTDITFRPNRTNRVVISDSSVAALSVESTTQGFRPPRMTTTQKNAIATPSAGLVVYDTTLNKLCVYTTAWETITSI
jgi:hypothetical protein